MTRDEVPTPALVVDASVLDANISKMASYFANRKTKLRPHFKAHKCVEIARAQIAKGSTVGLTCATVRELEVLRQAGFPDVLLANEISTQDKAERVANVARDISVKVAVDSRRQIDLLEEACSQVGGECGVLVDINVGLPRCGIQPSRAPKLAQSVVDSPHLRFEGLMGYEGHCVLLEDPQLRRDNTLAAMDLLLEAKEAVEAAGIEVRIVSAGGTGTYDITGNLEFVTEIQAGSYVLMDDAYYKLGLGFERGLYLLCTVISRSSSAIAVADGGLKALSTDHGLPTVLESKEAKVAFLSDEHATILAPPDRSELEEGSKIHLTVTHIDPTINMHDELWVLDGEKVVDVWPIAARGYGRRSNGGC